MKKSKQQEASPISTVRTTTCREAAELSKTDGVRIFWRPNGVINWMLPELDVAQVLED